MQLLSRPMRKENVRSAARSRSSSKTRRLAIENLENRLAMTAAVPAPGLLGSDGPLVVEVGNWEVGSVEHTESDDAGHELSPALCLQFQLEIIGTGIEFDPATGLPSHLEGDVFYVGGQLDGKFAGVYHEDVTPILHPQYGFIGADGVGVYEFQVRPDGAAVAGLTVQYQAFIVGVDAAGAMLVQTAGQVVGGAGMLKDVAGGFTSSSTVLVTPWVFAMNVDVNLHVHRPLPFAGVNLAARGGGGQAPRTTPESSPNNPASSFAQADSPSARGRGWQAHSEALDRAFADSSKHDWLEDHLLELESAV